MSYSENLAKQGLGIRFPVPSDEEAMGSIIDSSFISNCDGMLDKNGNNRVWIMDCRKGLSDSKNLQIAADWFVSILDKNNIDQVVVRGYGASLLVGSILVTSYNTLRAGLIRDKSKGYDANVQIEGSLDNRKPVLLIDDILNSGTSSKIALSVLKDHGFKKISAAFLMKFSVGLKGEVELKKRGIQDITHAMEVFNK